MIASFDFSPVSPGVELGGMREDPWHWWALMVRIYQHHIIMTRASLLTFGDCSLICMNKNVFSCACKCNELEYWPWAKTQSCRGDLDTYFFFTVTELRFSNPLGGSEALALYRCTHEHIDLFTLYFSFLFRKSSFLVLADVTDVLFQ